MVRNPHPTDRQKARDICEIRRPLVLELLPKVLQARRDVSVQDQECGGNREYAVAERLDPALVPGLIGFLVVDHQLHG